MLLPGAGGRARTYLGRFKQTMQSFVKLSIGQGRHGKRQFLYTSKVSSKTILPKKVRKFLQK